MADFIALSQGRRKRSDRGTEMIRDLSFSALYMGLLAAFVGYSASFAIVLAGLSAMQFVVHLLHDLAEGIRPYGPDKLETERPAQLAGFGALIEG